MTSPSIADSVGGAIISGIGGASSLTTSDGTSGVLIPSNSGTSYTNGSTTIAPTGSSTSPTSTTILTEFSTVQSFVTLTTHPSTTNATIANSSASALNSSALQHASDLSFEASLTSKFAPCRTSLSSWWSASESWYSSHYALAEKTERMVGLISTAVPSVTIYPNESAYTTHCGHAYARW